MHDYLKIKTNPIRAVLPALLRDKTTGRNIVWGTDSYAGLNEACRANAEITMDALLKLDAFELQPRCMKAKEEQLNRTRSKAEVFTPSWICNKMNNVCDDEWFGVPGVFNTEDGQTWRTTEGLITFPEGRKWQHYVDSRRLEITCGEAPFISSRYDTSTGEPAFLRWHAPSQIRTVAEASAWIRWREPSNTAVWIGNIGAEAL